MPPPLLFYTDPEAVAILGDWIVTKGIIEHHGIVTDFYQDPVSLKWDLVVTHSVIPKVCTTTLEGFSQGKPVELYARPNSYDHQQMILATARHNIGKRYSQINKTNCEHFASFCHTHVATSPQVGKWVLAAGCVVGLFAAIKYGSKD